MAEFLTTPGGMALIIAAQVLLVIGFVMISLLFLVYGDRKIWAAVQMRRGPNVVGAFGLLQTVADALKYVVKEIVIPAGADRTVFMLAPMLSFVLAMIAWAVIPFNETWVLADINVAILYVFAISSLHVYGVIMGGWASNSKYPFLGSLRSAAQMISYEVSIGLIIIGVILSTGSMNFGDIVRAQDTGWGLLGWYWLPHLPMVAVLHLGAGRDEPPALRPAGGGIRTRGGLPGRIFLDPVPPVHGGRIHLDLPDVRADVLAVLRGLALAHPGAAGRRALDGRQDGVLLLPHRDGEGHRAALPLRPAHADRLEGVPAAEPRLGRDRGVPRPFRDCSAASGRAGRWEVLT
jgi:hypothetical protein